MYKELSECRVYLKAPEETLKALNESAELHEETDQTLEEKWQQDREDTNTHTRLILIIEEDADLLKSIEQCLTNEYEVHHATGRAKAVIELIKTSRYDFDEFRPIGNWRID